MPHRVAFTKSFPDRKSAARRSRRAYFLAFFFAAFFAAGLTAAFFAAPFLEADLPNT